MFEGRRNSVGFGVGGSRAVWSEESSRRARQSWADCCALHCYKMTELFHGS